MRNLIYSVLIGMGVAQLHWRISTEINSLECGKQKTNYVLYFNGSERKGLIN